MGVGNIGEGTEGSAGNREEEIEEDIIFPLEDLDEKDLDWLVRKAPLQRLLKQRVFIL